MHERALLASPCEERDFKKAMRKKQSLDLGALHLKPLNHFFTYKNTTTPFDQLDNAICSINIPQIPLLHVQLTHVIHSIYLIKTTVLLHDIA